MSVRQCEPSPITKLLTGHTVESIDEDLWEKISKQFPNYDGLVRFQPGNWVHSNYAPKVLNRLYNFNFTPDDVLVLTYPKSGTTWLLEIVWNLRHNPNLDNPMADTASDYRAPHIEVDINMMARNIPPLPKESKMYSQLRELGVEDVTDGMPVLAYLEKLTGPKVIKTHLPLDLLPPSVTNKSKVIYVARDPRKVIVSKFHFFRLLSMHSFQGSLDEFVDFFINEDQWHHPYFSHIKSAWDLRDHPNMFFMFYEDLLADPLKSIGGVSKFLGLSRTPEQIKNVTSFTSFDTTKKRVKEGKLGEPASEGGTYRTDPAESLYRKGKATGWEKDYSDESIKKINEWMAKNLKQFGDDFKYKKEF